MPKLAKIEKPIDAISQSTVATTAPTETQRILGASRSGATRYSTASATETTAATSTQRAACSRNRTTPLSIRSKRVGNTATRPSITIMKMIAPTVSSRASPRFFTNERFCSSSYAVLIAVIRLPTPPEALHSANTMAITAPRPARVCPGRDHRQLVGDQAAGIFGQRLGQLTDLAGDLRRIGDQAVDQHQGDQRGKESQEGVEGDTGRQQWDLVGLGLGPTALGDLQPAAGGNLGRLVRLASGHGLRGLPSL